MIPDFPIQEGVLTQQLHKVGVKTFGQACRFVQELPYGRNANRSDLSLVVSEKQGTCSTKHAFLASVASENDHPEVELICGMFLMSPDTHPVLAPFFQGKTYTAIPEAHCYLKVGNKRFDFTSLTDRMPLIETKLLREHRIEPHQVGEWKVNMHKSFLASYLSRHPEMALEADAFWKDREHCIVLLSNGNR